MPKSVGAPAAPGSRLAMISTRSKTLTVPSPLTSYLASVAPAAIATVIASLSALLTDPSPLTSYLLEAVVVVLVVVVVAVRCRDAVAQHECHPDCLNR